MKGRTFLTGIVAILAIETPWTAQSQTVPNRSSSVIKLLSKPAAPLSTPVNVDEAVRYGLQNNPQITAAEAGVASAASNYRSLAAPSTIDFGVTRVQGTSTAPSLTGADSDTILDVGHTLDTSGQRRFQAAGAKAQYGATKFQFEETRLTLTQQIRDAYWSLAAARAQTRIAKEILQSSQQVNQLILKQEQAGAAPRVDVIRSSIDVANSQQAAVTAEGAEKAALSAFNVLLGQAPLATVELSDQLTETPASQLPLPELPSLEELNKKALAQRPLVKAASEQVKTADYATKQARAARLPDVAVDYERSVQQSQPADSLVFVARFPLIDLGSVRYSIKSAAEAKRQAEEQQKQTEQQVSQQVAQAHTDYILARTQVTNYFSEILTPSIKLLAMAELGYKQGGTGILPVIDAETTLRNARNGYVTAILNLYKARDEVQAAVGGL